MKKYFTRLLTLAVIAPALVSCAEQLPDFGPQVKKHTVYFSTAEEATRTGLSIDDGIVTPDWRDTDPNDVHVFEMDGTNDGVMGQTTDLSMYEENLAANFKVDFEEDMTIYVETPPSPTLPADGTRASGSGTRASGSGYTYGAVVAKMDESKEEPVFYIPATQNPDPNTLKDPEAEFLIGFSRDAYDAAPDGESNFVDLYFDRVAALSRIGFSEFQGTNEKVMSIKINSETSMTGWASFNDIRFGNTNTVTFHQDEGRGLLALNYGDGLSVTAGETFYAYFVSMPGTFKITSIEILTDQYSYTKEINKDVEFTITELKNLKLIDATAEKISSNVWYKASVLEAGYDYLIVSGGQALKNNDGATAAVAVTSEDGILSFESATDPTIIWRATAHTENTGDNGQGGIIAGHFTLTNDGMYLLRDSQTITLGDAIPSAKPKYAVWDYDGTYLKQESSETQTQYCYYDNGWATGYTQNGTAPTSSIKTVEIFTNRPPQGIISFEAERYSKVLEEGTFTIEVQGEHIGDVTYSSSNTEIATVNEDTGEVTPVKSGTVKIIATAAGSDTYQAAVAKYELTITSNSVTTWYKAEDVEDNGVYMIISNGYALKLNSSNGLDAVSDEAFTGEDSFQYEADESMKWTAGASSGKFTFKSGSRYLSRSSGTSGTATPATSSGTSYSWSYDGVNNNLSNVSSNNTTYYLYVSGNGNKWALSTDGTGTHTSTLYTTTAPLPAWEMSYSNETVEYDLATHTWTPAEPTLTTNAPTVTYESSDQEVASVTAAGVVAPLKRGITIITATAVADATHKKAEASYQLKVIDSSIPTNRYTKVTSTALLEDGAQYILVYETASKAFKPILNSSGTYFTKSAANAFDVTISNGVIESPDLEDCHITLEEGYYLYIASEGKYLYPSASGDSALGAEDKTSGHTVAISFDSNGIVTIARSNDSSYHLYWSSSNYFSGINSTSSSYAPNICLYKLDDGRQEQILNFNPAIATYDLYTPSSFVKPTLSTAYGDVTYSTSDATIAEVDNSGNITGKKVGTVTITATAAGDTQYKPGSASYELTVVDNTPVQTSTYVLIPSSNGVVSGATYLIVSADASNYNGADHKKAFAGDEDGTAVDVSASNGTITGNYSDYEFTITKSGSNYTLLGPNGYVTGNQNKTRFIEVSSSEVTMSLTTASELSAATSGDGKVADAFYFYYTKSNSKEVLYYNSDSQYKMGGTGRQYGVYLYMKYNGEPLTQNLSFSKDAAIYNMASSASFSAPTLSGAMTPVMYSSSKPGVATVNSSTGDVTFVGVGETTITAAAAAGTVNGINYGAASTSYKLTVTNEEITAYYEKITSTDGLAVGGKYLIVYESTDGNKLFKPLLNDAKNGWQTAPGNAIDVEIANNVIASNETTDACAILLDNQKTGEFTYDLIVQKADGTTDYYLVVYNNSSTFVATTSSGYRPTISFSGGIASIKRGNYFIRYSASNSYFQVTSSNSANVSLYRYVE